MHAVPTPTLTPNSSPTPTPNLTPNLLPLVASNHARGQSVDPLDIHVGLLRIKQRRYTLGLAVPG